MAANFYTPSPLASCKNIEVFSPYSWQQEELNSSAIDPTMEVQPEKLLNFPYDTLDYSFDNWSNIDDFELGVQSHSSPFELLPESPLSGCSSTTAESLRSDIEINSDADCGYLLNEPTAMCTPPFEIQSEVQAPESTSLDSNQPFGRQRVLSPDEIQELYAIAMPHLSTSTTDSSASATPESDFNEDSVPQKWDRTQKRPAKPKAKSLSTKSSHNAIEKRYRSKLNNKIAELRETIPSLCDHEDNVESGVHVEKKSKRILNKATVLSAAIDYIASLEKRNKTLAKEKTILYSKVTALEGIILGGKR